MNDKENRDDVSSEVIGVRYFILGLAAILMIGVMGSGCAQEERKVPVTQLPTRPASAEMPCEYLTDEEIIQCIKDPKTKDACRKVETNCARYDNLKAFVRRTWEARDGK